MNTNVEKVADRPAGSLASRRCKQVIETALAYAFLPIAISILILFVFPAVILWGLPNVWDALTTRKRAGNYWWNNPSMLPPREHPYGQPHW